jgi:hypothetical protein
LTTLRCALGAPERLGRHDDLARPAVEFGGMGARGSLAAGRDVVEDAPDDGRGLAVGLDDRMRRRLLQEFAHRGYAL